MQYEIIEGDVKIKQFDEEERKWREIYYLKNRHIFLLRKGFRFDIYIDGNSTLADISLRLKFQTNNFKDHEKYYWIEFSYKGIKYRIILKCKRRINWSIMYKLVSGGVL